jgi:MFS family permease
MISCAVLVVLDIYGTRKGVVPPESKETGEPFKLKQIKDMPLLFWLASAMCVTVYCSVFPLIGIAKNFFQVKYHLDGGTASSYVSVYQFVCAGGSPISGGIVDVVGRFSIWMIVAGAGFTLVHLIFIVADPPAFVMMGAMGIVYSVLVASLWPAVPYVVQGDLVGLAYGIMTAMQNSGLATWPLISGAILDAYQPPTPDQSATCHVWNHNRTIPNKADWGPLNFSWMNLSECCNATPCKQPLPTLEGYKWTEVFFMCTAASGTLVATILFFVDRAKLGVLGSSPARREAIKEEQARLTAAIHEHGDLN